LPEDADEEVLKGTSDGRVVGEGGEERDDLWKRGRVSEEGRRRGEGKDEPARGANDGRPRARWPERRR
jgi:hypothetical protein